MRKLRCYCCGEPIGKRFALVSMSAPTDRVFVLKSEHVNRVDDPEVAMYVVAT